MACPHVIVVVAFVKSFHSNWSPSATKFALMTTDNFLSSLKLIIEIGIKPILV